MIQLTKQPTLKKHGQIFCGAAASRLLLLLLGFIMLKITNNSRSLAAIFSTASDTPHYLYLAENWYATTGDKANLLVFYPLYPLLIKIVHFFVRNYTFAGLLISYICFGVASCYLYDLLRLDYDKPRSIDGLMAFWLFPFGFFYMAVFTESLFVMLTVMALYYTRKHNWLAVGITGLLAAATRTQGILVLVPAVIEIIYAARERFLQKEKWFSPSMLYILLIPVGYLSYLILNKIYGGSFTKFLEYQSAAPWYNSAQWIGNNITQQVGMAKDHFYLSLIIYWPEILLFFVAAGIIFYGIKHRANSLYLAYLGVYTATSYLHGWLISGPRYFMACAAVYLIFAEIKNESARRFILFMLALWLMLFNYLWFSGQAIM